MTVLQTVLVYVVIPVGIYGTVALLTLRDRVAKAPRYRPGQPWDHPPVWWTGNPAGMGDGRPGFGASPTHPAGPAARRTAKGGARGSW